jgi:MFS family permease
VVVLLSTLLVTNFIDRMNFTVAGPLIIRDLGLTQSQFGILLAVFQGSYAVMNLPAGPLLDRVGTRRTLGTAAVLWSCFAAMTGLGRSFAALLLLRTGLGIADAPMYPAMVKAINAWFPDRERGTAISICQACFYVASGLSAPLIALLMLQTGWRAMFAIVGVLGLLPVIAWWAIYREPAEDRHLGRAELAYIVAGQANRNQANRNDDDAASSSGFGGWAGLFALPGVWTMVAAGFFLQFAMGFYLWVPVYLQQARGVTIMQAGLLTALPYIGGAIGELIGGQISDRLIRRGMDPFLARRATIAGGALLTAGAMATMPLAATLPAAVGLLTLGMFAGGIGNGAFHIMPTVLSTSPRLVGSLSSIQNFGGLAALAVAPLTAGFVVEATGGYTPVFLVSAGCSVLAALLYIFVMRRRLAV